MGQTVTRLHLHALRREAREDAVSHGRQCSPRVSWTAGMQMNDPDEVCEVIGVQVKPRLG